MVKIMKSIIQLGVDNALNHVSITIAIECLDFCVLKNIPYMYMPTLLPLFARDELYTKYTSYCIMDEFIDTMAKHFEDELSNVKSSLVYSIMLDESTDKLMQRVVKCTIYRYSKWKG